MRTVPRADASPSTEVSQGHTRIHAIWPMIGAFAPAEIPPQTRNAARDARAPAPAALPVARPLQRLSMLVGMREDHVAAKLDQRATFVPRNGTGG